MKQFKISLAIAGFMFGMGIGIALAADEPTVTLTQAELQEIVNAQIAAAQAAPAFKKVQGAFAPVPVKPAPMAPTIADPTK